MTECLHSAIPPLRLRRLGELLRLRPWRWRLLGARSPARAPAALFLAPLHHRLPRQCSAVVEGRFARCIATDFRSRRSHARSRRLTYDGEPPSLPAQSAVANRWVLHTGHHGLVVVVRVRECGSITSARILKYCPGRGGEETQFSSKCGSEFRIPVCCCALSVQLKSVSEVGNNGSGGNRGKMLSEDQPGNAVQRVEIRASMAGSMLECPSAHAHDDRSTRWP